jgi:hypothetical protein
MVPTKLEMNHMHQDSVTENGGEENWKDRKSDGED